jgi:predicted site-specific integrase-resolvase
MANANSRRELRRSDRQIIYVRVPIEKMIKRKVRLKITTSSRRIVRPGGQNPGAPCTACGREVELVTATQAAVILQVGEHELERFAGAGAIHLVQTVSGRHWVCKNSLFRNEERP